MDKKIFLVSSSPRRIELLRELKFNFEVLPYSFKEDFVSHSMDPVFLACDLAMKKLESVILKPEGEGIAISADTLVFLGSRIFGKPESEREAREYLSILSENTHSVVTAIAARDVSKWDRNFISYSLTKVRFSRIDDDLMDWYISTGDWKDKAGGYGIQGKASLFVEGIEGCFYNVVGFPVNLFLKLIYEFGYTFFDFKKG